MSNEDNNPKNSGFTSQEQHDIIMATLSEFGKGPECFQQRWKEESGEHLTPSILLQTPMFWYMKYKWSRQEIETIFFKAHIVISSDFDRALQQTFGGDPGARWKGGGGVKKKEKKEKQYSGRNWMDPDFGKNKKDDDSMNYKLNHPDFQYNPVDQTAHFQATGGVNNKEKENEMKKEYGKPDWERLKKKSDDNNKGSGPTMGKGKKSNDDIDENMDKAKSLFSDILDGDEEESAPKNSKLNSFLDDICDEIKEDGMNGNLSDENGSDNNGEEKDDYDILAVFSKSELDVIENETKNKKRGSEKRESGKRGSHKRISSKKASIRTTITTAKLKEEIDHKLKRCAGGLNIASKSNTIHLLQKSNTLRREKAKLQAITDAKKSKSETNVIKHEF